MEPNIALLKLVKCLGESAYGLHNENGFDVHDIGAALIAAGAGFLKAEMSPQVACEMLTRARRALICDLSADQVEQLEADIERTWPVFGTA